MVVAKAQGHGSTCVRSIHKWILDFVQEGMLPLHFYCGQQTILEDEGILQEIQKQLTEKTKSGFIKAQDVCEIIASVRVQMKLTQPGNDKLSISLSTAHWWLAKLKWQYRKRKNRMYFDGHERVDVVAY